MVGLDHQVRKQLPNIPKVSCFNCSMFVCLFCIICFSTKWNSLDLCISCIVTFSIVAFLCQRDLYYITNSHCCSCGLTRLRVGIVETGSSFTL